MLVKGVLRVPWLKHESRLNAHELLDDGLVRLGQDWVPLLIVNEGTNRQLHAVKFLAVEAVYDPAVGQIGFEDEQDGEEDAVLGEVLQRQVPLEDPLRLLIVSGQRHTNHKLLLKSQILQVSVQDAGKVID